MVGRDSQNRRHPARSLYLRLKASLASPPEQLFFRTYFKTFHNDLGHQLPGLVPQVYLHYDPYTLKMHGGAGRLPRQRMDFLLLLSSRERVVIEIDGKQHYAAMTVSRNHVATPKWCQPTAAEACRI